MAPVSEVTGPNERPTHTVLFVDDDEDTLDFYRRLFSRDSLRILTAPSGLHALDLLAREKAHLIVSDYSMIGMNGNDLLREVGRLYPLMGRLLLTGEADSQIVIDAPCRVLTKGMDPGLIQRVIVREARRHG